MPPRITQDFDFLALHSAQRANTTVSVTQANLRGLEEVMSAAYPVVSVSEKPSYSTQTPSPVHDEPAGHVFLSSAQYVFPALVLQ